MNDGRPRLSTTEIAGTIACGNQTLDVKAREFVCCVFFLTFSPTKTGHQARILGFQGSLSTALRPLYLRFMYAVIPLIVSLWNISDTTMIAVVQLKSSSCPANIQHYYRVPRTLPSDGVYNSSESIDPNLASASWLRAVLTTFFLLKSGVLFVFARFRNQTFCQHLQIGTIYVKPLSQLTMKPREFHYFWSSHFWKIPC